MLMMKRLNLECIMDDWRMKSCDLIIKWFKVNKLVSFISNLTISKSFEHNFRYTCVFVMKLSKDTLMVKNEQGMKELCLIQVKSFSSLEFPNLW